MLFAELNIGTLIQILMFMISFTFSINVLLQVWQAFAGVSTRWVERYYQDLLAPETHIGDKDLENLLSDNSNRGTCSEKWRRQIEKVITSMGLGLYRSVFLICT